MKGVWAETQWFLNYTALKFSTFHLNSEVLEFEFGLYFDLNFDLIGLNAQSSCLSLSTYK